MKNKKWMAILLGGIMAASLAAPCSVSAAEKTTLTFWHAMGGTNGEVLQQIVDDFNASQDEIEVKAEYQGTYDDTITKLKAAMQSDSGLPDVCQMYDVGTKFMYDSGAVIPVEDKFESTGYDKSSVMDVISSYYTVDGKQYAMPFNVSTPMLYYNKDVFEAAGLDPETPPTTYDEVLEDAKKIVESGAAPVGYSQAIYGWFFEQQLAGLGVTYGNNDNGRGMIIASTAILKNAVDSSPFEVGTGYLPRIEQNDEGGVIIGGGSLWLTDTGNEANEDAAWKFIEYITTPDVQAKWSMGTGYFAINEKAYETDDMKAYLEENPNFETAINQLKDSPVNCNTAGVLSGVQTEARLTFNEIMPQVYDGKLTTQDAVDQLAASVNKAIENYNESIK